MKVKTREQLTEELAEMRRRITEVEVERAHQKGLQSIFECIGDGVAVTDLELKLIDINPTGVQLLGYRRKEELIGKDAMDIISDKDHARAAEDISATLLDGQSGGLEYSFLRRDGAEIQVELAVAVLKDSSGSPSGFVVTIKDITERKRAEEPLKEGEERYRGLFENSIEAVFTANLEGNITSGNRALEELSGYDLEELVGMSWERTIPPEGVEALVKEYGEMFRTGKPILGLVYETIRKDGERQLVEKNVNVIRKGNRIIGCQGTVRDITEKKRAEEALRASEEKWRSLGENVPNIIMVMNRDGKIEFVNRTIPDGNVEKALGKTIYDYTEPRYHNTIKEIIENVFRTGDSGSFEAKALGFDGEIIWYEIKAGPIERDGRIVAVMVIVSDITELKQAQERLENSFIDVVETVSRAIETRDPYTAGHQRRVAKLAQLVGEKLGLSGDRLQGLYIGGLLHDIGKISIPASILSKMGKLTEEEWALICSHPEQGYNILKDTRLPWPVADITLHHHERLDGSGYPHGIKGDKLGLEVRILAVCDVVEAMGSHRPYRPARTKKEVLAEIEGGRGIKYDADVGDLVLQIIENGEFEFTWNSRDSKDRATKVPVPPRRH